MQQQDAIKINIACNSSPQQNVNNAGTSKANNRTGRRRFKGHGWSASKQSRRLKKQKRKQRFNFYAVFVGRNGEEICDTWDECNASVFEFQDAKFKGFQTRVAAIDWLQEQRHKRMANALIHQHRQQQQQKEVPTATVSTEQSGTGDHIPMATATPIASAVPVVPTNPNPNPIPQEPDFSPVAEMTRLIASYPAGEVPPPPSCSAVNCPYVCGEIMHMQRILLQRLYQTTFITAQHHYEDHKL